MCDLWEKNNELWVNGAISDYLKSVFSFICSYNWPTDEARSSH